MMISLVQLLIASKYTTLLAIRAYRYILHISRLLIIITRYTCHNCVHCGIPCHAICGIETQEEGKVMCLDCDAGIKTAGNASFHIDNTASTGTQF